MVIQCRPHRTSNIKAKNWNRDEARKKSTKDREWSLRSISRGEGIRRGKREGWKGGRRVRTYSQTGGFRLVGLTSVTDLSLPLFFLQPQAVLSPSSSCHPPAPSLSLSASLIVLCPLLTVWTPCALFMFSPHLFPLSAVRIPSPSLTLLKLDKWWWTFYCVHLKLWAVFNKKNC